MEVQMILRVLLVGLGLVVWGNLCMANEGIPPLKKVLGLYGVSLDKAPFEGKSATESAQFIADLGANTVFGGYDDGDFVRACKDVGISVYASVGIFTGENNWNAHPESRPVTAEGGPMDKVEWYAGVCPNQPWLRAEKLEVIKHKAEKTPIDGIWLDFIRYPVHWENGEPRPRKDETCFCPVCLEKFQKDTGVKLPENISSVTEIAEFLLNERMDAWYPWRCQQIVDFVEDASKVLHEVNSEAKLGLFCVPWLPKDYGNAMYRVVGQDLRALAQHVDVFSPMVYHKLCKHDPAWVAEVSFFVAQQTGKPVWPITQAFNEPDEMGAEEFEKSVGFGLKPPSRGVLLFSFGHLVKEERLGEVQRIFRSVK